MVGSIVSIRNRFRDGPAILHQSQVGEALRKHIVLCSACRKYKPQAPDQCPIAALLFGLTQKHGLAAPVTRCGEFVRLNAATEVDDG